MGVCHVGGWWARAAGTRRGPTLRSVPDDPTTPPGDRTGSAPPGPDEYGWHAPSPYAYRGAGAYAPPGWPYGPPPFPPPYGQHGPYGFGAWPSPPPARVRSPEERRRRRRRALAMAGVVVLALGAGIGIGAAIAPTSPASVAAGLVNRAIAAATNAKTYHYVERSTTFGAPDDIAGDAAPDGGRQVILQRCSGGTTYFDLRLVHGAVYFKGTRVAVIDQLGVPTRNAPAVAGRWVKLTKGEGPYAQFEAGITTRSNVSQLRTNIVPVTSRAVPGSPSTEVLGGLYRTQKHHRMIGTAALVIANATGRPRSLRGSAASTNGGHVTLAWTFSHYGEKVHVVAPPHALAYSSLHAKPPAKGTCG